MKLLVNFLFTIMAIHSYSQDGQTILARAELKKKFGCIDTTGNEIIPIKYDAIGFWGNNLIPVNIGAREINYLKKGGKWGYCNNKGALTIPVQFTKAETFSEGIAAIKLNKKWGFIDTAGNIIIEVKYDEVRMFAEGLCAVSINKKWGFIDTDGDEVIHLEYGEAMEFKNGVAVVFVGQKASDEWEDSKGNYCLINKKGDKISEARFKMIWNFSEGLAKVEISDTADTYAAKKGFISTNGEIVVPVIYDIADDFSEGFAAVGIKNKNVKNSLFDENYTYGYVNTKGKEVIKIQFDQARRFFRKG